MLPRPVRYLTVLVSAYAQVFDLFCQEQVKSKHERYANLQIQKSLIKITPDMLPWIISHLNNISCREKQTNKQTNKNDVNGQKSFCSAIATILQHQDLLLRPISFWHQGCTCASTNLLLPTFRDNLFNIPYSISEPCHRTRKFYINNDNLIYRNNQDCDRKSYFIRNSELWSLLKSSIKTIHSFSTFLKPPYTLFISQNQKLINLLAIDICFKYNCLGDYRDARTLIGREVHHISL